MPIQSTAHRTIGRPAPAITMPRQRSVNSSSLLTGSYAIAEPKGGVASTSNVATRIVVEAAGFGDSSARSVLNQTSENARKTVIGFMGMPSQVAADPLLVLPDRVRSGRRSRVVIVVGGGGAV